MPWHGGFREYVPVAQRRANARRQMDRLRKRGHTIEPVEIEGRTIARSFWGKGWCDHLESFSDFSNRLPRGRTYARNGSVCHLSIQPGVIEAHVAGSELYSVKIGITKLDARAWERIKRQCAGQIGSMLELLQGRLSDQVMAVVADRDTGLFPKPGQIEFDCTCPDWATMCKHVAAVLYGVGNRLDAQPALLFTLRHADPQELIAVDLGLPDYANDGAQTLADDQLADVFGIDLDGPSPSGTPVPSDDAPTRPATRAKTQAEAKSKAKPKTRGQSKRQRKGATQSDHGASGPSAEASPSKSQAEPHHAKRNGRPTLRPTGKSVARLRRRAGLTQSQFAERLGVSPASVARWECTVGRLKLQRRCLEALADVKHDLERR